MIFGAISLPSLLASIGFAYVLARYLLFLAYREWRGVRDLLTTSVEAIFLMGCFVVVLWRVRVSA